MKKEWQKFVNEMIKHGDKDRAYKAAYNNCKTDKSAKTNASRLLKNATILESIKKGSFKASLLANDAAIKASAVDQVDVLLSAIEKRTILAKIARGESKIMENKVNFEGEVITYYRDPNANEIIKAIESDNKMTGDNAPEIKQLTGKDGKDLFPSLSDDELNKLIDELS